MQGKKIKETRKLLKITQHQLSSGKVARNLISEIENGNTPLTHKNAVDFLYQFLYYALNKGISVDLEFLLESVKEQKEIDTLKEIMAISFNLCTPIDDLEELEQLETAIRTVPHNLLRLELYNKIADQFMRIGQSKQFLSNKIKSVDLLILENQCQALENALFELEPILLETQSNHEFLSILLLSLGVFNRNKHVFNNELYYSIAFAYKQLNFFEKALQNINHFIDSEENEKRMARGLVLKATILCKLQQNDLARDCYSQASILLLKTNDYVNYTVTLANIINMIVISNTQPSANMLDSIQYYCSMLEQNLTHIETSIIKVKVASKLAYGYSAIGKDDKALDLFSECLKQAFADECFEDLVYVINDAIDFYDHINQLNCLEPYIQALLKQLEQVALTTSCEKAILKYLEKALVPDPAINLLSQFITVKFKS